MRYKTQKAHGCGKTREYEMVNVMWTYYKKDTFGPGPKLDVLMAMRHAVTNWVAQNLLTDIRLKKLPKEAMPSAVSLSLPGDVWTAEQK